MVMYYLIDNYSASTAAGVGVLSLSKAHRMMRGDGENGQRGCATGAVATARLTPVKRMGKCPARPDVIQHDLRERHAGLSENFLGAADGLSPIMTP